MSLERFKFLIFRQHQIAKVANKATCKKFGQKSKNVLQFIFIMIQLLHKLIKLK